MSEDETTEGEALTQIVSDLQAQFPAIAREIIAEYVFRACGRMGFCSRGGLRPVLVQRQARLSLTAMINADATADGGGEHRDSATAP